MHKLAKNFLDSLSSQLLNTASISTFITEETFINGSRFSFRGHEYQEYLMQLVENNPGYTFSVTKMSQCGLSEIFYRCVLSIMAIRPATAALLAMPSKQFSQEVLKTRINSIIYESPRLKNILNNNVDSASVKQFHNNSILYALSGSKSSNSNLLNRPISITLCDELDRMDSDIVSGFRSRMTHTPPEKRLVIKISTPTASGIGIDADFSDSREQHTALVVCEHCGHAFEPDFYSDVVLPGYDGDLRLLTKGKLVNLDVQQAYLQCPECLGDMRTRETQWHVEINPKGMPKTIGVKLNPFIAPAFISVPDLVESSLTYTSHVEFLNQGLGRVADLRDSSIQREDIRFEHRKEQVAQRIFACDMGKLCHAMIGRLHGDTTIHVDEAHVVKLSDIEDFFQDAFSRYAFSAAVMDSQPYSDLAYKFVRKYGRLYSAIYVSPTTPIPELFKLSMHDKHGEVVRQVNINKSPMMDLMANSMRDFISFEPSPMEGAVVKHLLDMRRVRDYRFEEMIYQWVKSKQGEDHFFHTLVYLFTASKLAIADLQQDFVGGFSVHKFKLKH